jgi:hypothetical protein
MALPKADINRVPSVRAAISVQQIYGLKSQDRAGAAVL